ncbi:helix-turn-helix domain-containing protein [Lonsdalea britannica]|uniref:helix-turn-helix domain-containing protein n=1 Tax=Lonsdalea britannica TaxID=1082704 RepID=UPI0026EF2315|nr:helix-turn-helix domain-containing protein [Lonsdalea britannica]
MASYEALNVLQHYKTHLRDSVDLNNGVSLASWQNSHDRVTLENTNHHTLSLYIAGGYESYHKRPDGWFNGGGPDRFCLMPKHSISTWDIRSDLQFVHLYYTDDHLRALAEQIWDRSPASLQLEERVFGDDAQIVSLYRHFLLQHSWQDAADRLTLTTASTLLMTHVLRRYTQLQWALPTVRGGLAPMVRQRIRALIDARLAEPLTLADLAAEAGLSEFHFARMFRHSEGMAPHQFVMQVRLERAHHLVRHTALPMTDIALACGFSSSSHFSQRFRAAYGVTPSVMRQKSE